MFRKQCKINVSSAFFKKHVSRLYGGFSACHCIMFLNEKSRLLFVIGYSAFSSCSADNIGMQNPAEQKRVKHSN